MAEPWLVGGAALLALLLIALGLPWTLRRLPEPDLSPILDPTSAASAALVDGEPKRRYASLVRPSFIGGAAVATAGATVLGVGWMPVEHAPIWWILAVFAVPLAVIDAVTTWLPTRLCYAGLLGLAIAVIMVAVTRSEPEILIRWAIGAVAAGMLYLVAWLISRGGFGFGDVRFALLLGAAAGSGSWALLMWSLLAGSVVGGLFAVARILLRRRSGFAYAPSMLLGVYLAMVIVEPGPWA